MPNKTVISNFNPIEKSDTLTYNTSSNSKILPNFLAESFLIKLPNPHDKHNLQSAIIYYSSFMVTDYFCLNNTSGEKF